MQRIALLVLICIFSLVIILPLRPIWERTYGSTEVRILGGTIYAEADGRYRSMPVRFWFDGLQTDAPFRLRIIFRPIDSQRRQLTFTQVSIDSHGLAILETGPTWAGDREGNSTFVVGFLNLPLDADEAVLRIEFLEDGRQAASVLRLFREHRLKIVHAWIEAIMGG